MKIFGKAIQQLKARGRTQGRLADGDGKVCLLGAIMATQGGDAKRFDYARLQRGEVYRTSLPVLAGVIRDQYPDRIRIATISFFGKHIPRSDEIIIEEFNDNPNTTDEEVFQVLEKAEIKLWEQEVTK